MLPKHDVGCLNIGRWIHFLYSVLQADALLEDRRVRIEELQTVIDRDRDKNESLQAKYVCNCYS